MKSIKRCPHCRKHYTLGVNGVKGRCDQCAGVKRDRDGYAWRNYETKHTYQDVETGQIFTVTRSEAGL